MYHSKHLLKSHKTSLKTQNTHIYSKITQCNVNSFMTPMQYTLNNITPICTLLMTELEQTKRYNINPYVKRQGLLGMSFHTVNYMIIHSPNTTNLIEFYSKIAYNTMLNHLQSFTLQGFTVTFFEYFLYV